MNGSGFLFGKWTVGPVAWVAAGVSGVVASGIFLAATGVSARETRHRPGRDSFSHIQVDSTADLVRVISKNPALRRNYARHFRVPEERVLQFIKDALVPYTLPRDRKLTVFGVTRTGRIYPVEQRLKKGTRVWATRSGLPILKWVCSNPIGIELPGANLRKGATASAKGPTALRVASRSAVPVADLDSEPAPLLMVPGTPETPEVPTTPTPNEPTAELSGEASGAMNRISFPSAVTGGINVPLLPLAGLIGFATRRPTGVVAVPEPATLALALPVALLLPGLARRRR